MSRAHPEQDPQERSGARPTRRGLLAVPLGALAAGLAGSSAAAGEGDAPGLAPAPAESLNGHVLEVMSRYPLDGSYGYHWPKSGSWEGTTQTLRYGGHTLTQGDPRRRSYCCGLTFEVYVEALRLAAGGEVKGLRWQELHELRLRFFGDSKQQERRRLSQFGLESLGLGRSVTRLEDARAGDFLQLWRHSGSGHSAIFVNWTRDRAGEISGLVYWSSQGSTAGIGYSAEKIGPQAVKVDEIYLGRADWPLVPARRSKRVFAPKGE